MLTTCVIWDGCLILLRKELSYVGGTLPEGEGVTTGVSAVDDLCMFVVTVNTLQLRLHVVWKACQAALKQRQKLAWSLLLLLLLLSCLLSNKMKINVKQMYCV